MTGRSAQNILRESGLRLTAARVQILELFMETPIAWLDAESVIRTLERRQQEIPQPTVYRTLSDLARAGCLRREVRRKLAIMKSYYCFQQEEGAAPACRVILVCPVCRRRQEADDAQLSSLLEALARRRQMTLLPQTVTLSARCDSHAGGEDDTGN